MANLVWAKNTKTNNIGYGAKEIKLTNGHVVVELTPIGATKKTIWKNYVILQEGEI